MADLSPKISIITLNENGLILYDFFYIKFLAWQKYRDGEQIGCCQKLGVVFGSGHMPVR